MRNYGSTNSSAFLDQANYIETSIFEFLNAVYPTVISVKVTRIAGSIDFVVILTTNGSNVFPEPNMIISLLLQGIENNSVLKKLMPASNSSMTAVGTLFILNMYCL